MTLIDAHQHVWDPACARYDWLTAELAPINRPIEFAELRRNPKVVGIRNLIHNIPDPDWLLRPDVDEGLGVLEGAGVTFDLVAVLPRHLENVTTMSERHPRLKLSLIHI